MPKFPIPKLKLRPTLPSTLHINKPATLGLVALVVFIILLGIVSAFRVPHTNSDNANKSATLASLPGAAANPTTSVNPSLQNLPENYSDIDAIKKYAPDLAGNSKALADLQRDIAALKSRNLQQPTGNAPQTAENNTNSAGDQQAKNSGLFFSGITPPIDNSGLLKSGADGSSGASNTANQSSATPNIGSVGDTDSVANSTQNVADLQIQRLPQKAQINFYSKQQSTAQKLAVLKASDSAESIYDLHNMVQPASPYELQAGTLLPAVLITGINTSLAGTVVAQSRFNVYDSVKGKYLLIPKGSRIIGEYDAKTAYGQRRVLLTFNRVIRPDGSSILLGKPNAADLQGQSGIEGEVNNHWGKVLAAATLSTVLSVGAGVAADNTGGGTTYYRGAGQNAMLGAASGISQTGSSLANRAMEVQPTITLNPGFQFNIIVRRDMVMTPYQK